MFSCTIEVAVRCLKCHGEGVVIVRDRVTQEDQEQECSGCEGEGEQEAVAEINYDRGGLQEIESFTLGTLDLDWSRYENAIYNAWDCWCEDQKEEARR